MAELTRWATGYKLSNREKLGAPTDIWTIQILLWLFGGPDDFWARCVAVWGGIHWNNPVFSATDRALRFRKRLVAGYDDPSPDCHAPVEADLLPDLCMRCRIDEVSSVFLCISYFEFVFSFTFDNFRSFIATEAGGQVSATSPQKNRMACFISQNKLYDQTIFTAWQNQIDYHITPNSFVVQHEWTK